MENPKDVFIGSYVPEELKKALREQAASNHRSLSQEMILLLEQAARAEEPPQEISPATFTCLRCTRSWNPPPGTSRAALPKRCKHCKSPLWNTERRRPSKAA